MQNPDVPWWVIAGAAAGALGLWLLGGGATAMAGGRFRMGFDVDTSGGAGGRLIGIGANPYAGHAGWRPALVSGPGKTALRTGAGGGAPQGSYPAEVRTAVNAVVNAARQEDGHAVFAMDDYTVVRWFPDGEGYQVLVVGPNMPEGGRLYWAPVSGGYAVPRD